MRIYVSYYRISYPYNYKDYLLIKGLKSGGIFFLILFYKQSLSLLILVVIFLVVISYDYQVVEFN